MFIYRESDDEITTLATVLGCRGSLPGLQKKVTLVTDGKKENSEVIGDASDSAAKVPSPATVATESVATTVATIESPSKVTKEMITITEDASEAELVDKPEETVATVLG